MEPTMTAADVAYVRSNYVSLEQACEGRRESPDGVRRLIVANRLPQPSYVLADGTEMVPLDYFALADGGRDDFARRFVDAGGDPEAVDDEWDGYLSGAYGVCLKRQTAENIAHKGRLVDLIDGLLDSPQPGDAAWRDELRSAVDDLDALERPFAPDYDRARWGPSSRDRCITGARERFPEVFAQVGAGSPSASSA